MAARAAVAAMNARTGSKHIAKCWALSLLVPMAANAAIELGIPGILAKADGGKPLSAREILAKLPTKKPPGPNSLRNLTRLMRPLVKEGVFTEILNEEKQPAYGLTEISNFFVKDYDRSVVPLSVIFFSRQFQGGFSRLHEVILDDDTAPFEKELGMSFYEYVTKNPEFREVFAKAMTGLTQSEVKEVVDHLQQTGWLDGVKTFVDVGGGEGSFVSQVVAQNPHIAGINFDVAGVLEKAPELKGVQNVEGDFFKAVHSGDAMFIKYVIHNFDDEDCIKILSNCYEALPKGGKMIIAENMLNDSDQSPKASFAALADISMLAIMKGGLERTEAQYHEILSAAGFSNISTSPCSTAMDLIQGTKM